MPWFPFSFWKKKQDGINAVLLGPPASGKGTQVHYTYIHYIVT